MRADHDCVAPFQREHRVAHRGDDRVRGGRNRADDAHRFRDQHQTFFRFAVDNADGFAALHVVPDHARLALVFFHLVLIYAHSRFVHGHAGERLGVVADRFGDCAAGFVDLFLRAFFEFLLRRASARDQFLYKQFRIHDKIPPVLNHIGHTNSIAREDSRCNSFGRKAINFQKVNHNAPEYFFEIGMIKA